MGAIACEYEFGGGVVISTPTAALPPLLRKTAKLNLSLSPNYVVTPNASDFFSKVQSFQSFHYSVEEDSFNWTCYVFNYVERSVNYQHFLKVNDKALESLCRKVTLKIAELLLDWNISYLRSEFSANSVKSELDDLQIIEKLSHAHRVRLKEDDLWFNRNIEQRMNINLESIAAVEDRLKKLPRDILDLFEQPDPDSIEPPKITFIDKLFGAAKEKLNNHDIELNLLEKQKELIKEDNKLVDALNEKARQEYAIWINQYSSLISAANEASVKTAETISLYESGENILPFVSEVLKNSEITKLVDADFEREVSGSGDHLVLNYRMPAIDDIPRTKEKRYLKTKYEWKIIEYSDKEFQKVYSDIIYSILFRLLNELFTSDYANQVKRITFNGWVNSLNRKNGKHENKFILSLSVERDTFTDLVLKNIDPKQTFRALKGISGVNLSEMTPINPILQLNKTDSRFVEANQILSNVDESVNLALMDWEEFEHLVRELFEKEFEANGGEVKVTQSSRDGGVDAIAFDPDPIRGGKIVIQSKRYTNVVGVSAVRDLYGTVLNEGATKGIIVTTSHYGSDAYEFANGKPLTLLDGNNLLALLEKHGYKAKIDIRETRDS